MLHYDYSNIWGVMSIIKWCAINLPTLCFEKTGGIFWDVAKYNPEFIADEKVVKQSE